MQEKKRTPSQIFTERTDSLSAKLGVNVNDLPDFTGISARMIWAYRSGSHKITNKAWSKLTEAERRQEAQDHPPEKNPTPYPDDHSGYGVHLLRDAEKPITAADFAETKDRIKQLEEKLDLLLKHLGAKP